MASAISTSASPEQAPAAAIVFKEFRCTVGTCTKSFSRAEHLHRHALNHDEERANNTCLRCSAVFKRRDLLDRHMLRHKEKDDEAGGEGLGRLQTRKRLWRDSTGTVVAKRRPEHEKKRTNSSSSPRTPKVHRSSVVDSGSNFSHPGREPISPPKSLQDHAPIEIDVLDHSQMPHISTSTGEMWPMPVAVEANVLQEPAGPPLESFDFLCNASWGAQPHDNNNPDLLYNDLFAPDTASSFNMPFTTMNYYNWLFGSESWPAPGFDGHNSLGHPKFPAINGPPISQNLSTPSSSSRGLSVSDASGESNVRGQHFDHPSLGFKPSRATSDYGSTSYTYDAPTPEMSAASQILAMSQMAENNMAAALGYAPSIDPSLPSRSFASHSPALLPTPTNSASHDPIGSAIRFKQPRGLPLVNESARQGVLQFVKHARPKDLQGSEISEEDPLLSLETLQRYCDLYFSRFNVSYPLIHPATFDPSSIDPLLLVSVLLLGATYDDKDSHLFAISIHDVMRAQIFASCAFNTRPTLWMLQTILLVECFGKSRAGQLQHDMSHLFHGLLINLIRRSDCQSARCQIFDDSEPVDVERRWRAEVDAEQKRRLALLCFMWDTQHAVLFSQSLCMNAAELKLSLPWNEALWEADSAEEWCAINAAELPQPQYLAVLKTYINPRTEIISRPLNALSRVLMLHGLMSVAWDLNRRDQTSLGTSIAGKDESWQSRMARSYDAWKADFDGWSRDIIHSFSPDDETSNTTTTTKADFQRFTVSILSVYHAAHVILQVEINDLQIYAGATHIIGRPVTKPDRDRSRQRIERWTQHCSLSAATAASHAAFILRDGIRRLTDWDAGDVFHYPWVLYLATLTCWAFQTCSKIAAAAHDPDEGGEEEDAGTENGEDGEWDARAEMNALVSAMTRCNLEDLWKVAGKYRSTDLPRIMAKHLSGVRWAVVQEGMIVLRGLAGNGRGG